VSIPLLSLTTPLPLQGDVAHGLAGAVLYPLHEAAVKLEVFAALDTQKAPHILVVCVIAVYWRGRGDGVSVPIE